MKKFGPAAVLGFAAVIALSAVPQTADAATPYTCNCNGVTKRFLGATYFCGRRKPKCTAAEYVAFRRKGCAVNGCTVPGASRYY
jgi:hypothetical protein